MAKDLLLEQNGLMLMQNKEVNSMFRLKVKFGKVWKIGRVEYTTYDEAVIRMKELKAMKKSTQIKIVDELGADV